MNKFACLLMLMVGCNSCQTHVNPATIVDANVNHDVVAMKDVVTPKLQPEMVPSTGTLIPTDRNILIVGDSEACAVASQIKNVQLPTDTVNVDCKNGTVVDYWGKAGHLKTSLSKHPNQDFVVIFLGTNHYHQKTTPDVKPILDLVEASGVSCVWVGNTAVHGKKWPINTLLRDAVSPTCSYFDTEAANIPLPDGVHPGPQGALKWLNAVWPMITTKYEVADE